MRRATSRRAPTGRAARLVLALVLAAGPGLLLAAWPAVGWADGDPASDVLATAPVFVPGDGGLTQRQQADLGATVQAAQRSGYSIRVAIIASPADLGSVTALWRAPQSYARFLGQELATVFRGTLVVLMPDGVGIDTVGSSRPVEQGVTTVAGARLGMTAIAVVRELAASAGHPLHVASIDLRPVPSRGNAAATVAWVLGAALIVVAWGWSLLARRPRALSARPQA